MNSNKSIIIECSRENSIDVKANGLGTDIGNNNATWTNLTNLQLNEGDQVSVELSTIHAIGADNEDTIEISGSAEDSTGLTDNQTLLQFTPYVCNTGHNFVVCPYVGGNVPALEYNPNYDDGVNPIQYGLEYYQVIPQKTFRNAPAADGGLATNTGKRDTSLYGMPITNDDGAGLNCGFRFTPQQFDPTAIRPYPDINPNTPKFMKSANLLEQCDGSRFVKINRLYQGPFKKQDDTFFSTDVSGTNFSEETYDIPIEIEAPKFESPTVICNDINEKFHKTVPQTDNNFTTSAKAFENHNEDIALTRFAGPLFQYYAANAEIPDTDGYRDKEGNRANRFWMSMCVKDFNKWWMVHYGMRLEIIAPNFTPPGSGQIRRIHYPTYYSARYLQFRDSVGHPLANTWRFPCIKYEQYAGGKANPRQYRYYSTLPEYFLVATNIRWTQENITSLIEILKKNEKYDGDYNNMEQATKDLPNWYCTLDIGRTDECDNGVDDCAANTRHPLEEYYDPWNGGTFADKDKFNVLEKFVNWDEETLNALQPLTPYYQTGYNPPEQFSIDDGYLPVPSQKYERNTHNPASNLRVGGAMERAGSFTVYSRFLPEWKTKAKLRNFPDNFVQPQIYGDGMPTADGSNPFGNELYDVFNDPNHNLDVQNYGLYGMKIYEDDGSHHIVVGFMVYNPTAYRDPTTNRWYVDDVEARQNGYTGRTIRPSWCIPHLSYALGSPSSMDNPYGLIINDTITNNFNQGFSNGEDDPVAAPNSQYKGIPSSMKGFDNFVFLGANDPTCTFDASLSRASFQGLHTRRLLGVDELIFKKGSTTDVIGVNIGQPAVVFNDQGFPNGRFNKLTFDGTKAGKPSESKVENDTQSQGSFSDALSGVYISNVFFQKEGQLIQSSSDSNAILATKDNFYNTLLYKLGFRFGDLFPDFGLSNSRYNMGFQKDYNKGNRYNSVKPVTTNEDLTITVQPSTNLLDGGSSFSATGAGEPTYKLGLSSFNHFNISAPGSVQILASRLPTRLDTSFYLIYSDLVLSDYHQEEKTIQVVGIASKAYTSGDFFISFGDNSFSEITNTKKHTVKSITTQIRYPNGKLAALSEKSSVVYKIVKPFEQPTPEEIVNPVKTAQENVLIQLRKQNKNLEDLIDLTMELLNQKIDKKMKK